MKKLKLHQQRLMESLSNPEIVESTTKYIVSAFRRPTSRLQGRKLKFSPTSVHDANAPSFSTVPISPIRSIDDGLVSQGHVNVLVMDSDIELQQVEAPKVVAMVSLEAVGDVVVTNFSDSPS